MFRKTTLALAAAATLIAGAAIPTAASARDWHHGWRHHHRSGAFVVGFSAPYYAYGPECFTKKRWIHTHWGWRLHRVRVCR
jgi:hypothetical protein